MAKTLTQEQYDALRQQGLSNEKIKALANARGLGMPEDTLSKWSRRLDLVFGGGKIGEAIGTQIAKRTVPDEQRQFVTPGPTAKEVAGDVLRTGALFTPVGRIYKGITVGLRGLGAVRGVSAAGKVGAGAAAGTAFDVGERLARGEAPGLGLATGIGAGVPAVGVGLNILGRGAKVVAPKLLSYTSDTPEQAFDFLLQRRGPVQKAIKEGITPKQVLQETQGAVRGLRKSLTREWQEGSSNVINEFTGKRWGMGDKAIKLANRVADDFGIELPTNLKNMSINESLDLLKEVNDLYSKRLVRESAQGINVRKLKDFLKKSVVKNFGGEEGSVANLYKNYSTKKEIFDAADSLVKAYATKKPIQQATALGRLKALFNDNKSAYIDAILDLEKATGKDLMSKITALQFSSKLPRKLSSVSASGGLQAPKGIIDKALDLIILPLSSPRSAGFIAKKLSNIKSPGFTSPGDVLLGGKLGSKLEKGIEKGIIKKQAGLSIKDIMDVKTRTPEFKDAIKSTLERIKRIKSSDFIKNNKIDLDLFEKVDDLEYILKHPKSTIEEQKKALLEASRIMRDMNIPVKIKVKKLLK